MFGSDATKVFAASESGLRLEADYEVFGPRRRNVALPASANSRRSICAAVPANGASLRHAWVRASALILPALAAGAQPVKGPGLSPGSFEREEIHEDGPFFCVVPARPGVGYEPR